MLRRDLSGSLITGAAECRLTPHLVPLIHFYACLILLKRLLQRFRFTTGSEFLGRLKIFPVVASFLSNTLSMITSFILSLLLCRVTQDMKGKIVVFLVSVIQYSIFPFQNSEWKNFSD